MRPRPASLRALAAAVGVTGAVVLPVFLTGALAVQLGAELGFDESGLGFAVGGHFLSAAFCSIALGRAGERLGSFALRAAAVGSGLLLVGIGLSRSWIALTVCLSLGGVCNALAQPAANLLISRAIPQARQGLAFAIKQSAIPGATLLGGLSVPAVALTVGWRWAFFGAALLALGSAVLPPRVAAIAVDSTAPRLAARGMSLRPLAPLWLLALGFGFGAATANCLGTFLVSSSVASGLSPSAAGLNMAFGSSVGIAGRLLAGHLADRRGGRHFVAVALMLLVGALACAAFAIEHAWVVLLATPAAFGIGWAWPGVSNLAVVKNYPQAPAAATGITQTGVYAGAVLGPLAFGLLADHLGYRGAWLGAGACSALAALLVLSGRYALVKALREI